jgi:flagellar hook-length control protein FliK
MQSRDRDAREAEKASSERETRRAADLRRAENREAEASRRERAEAQSVEERSAAAERKNAGEQRADEGAAQQRDSDDGNTRESENGEKAAGKADKTEANSRSAQHPSGAAAKEAAAAEASSDSKGSKEAQLAAAAGDERAARTAEPKKGTAGEQEGKEAKLQTGALAPEKARAGREGAASERAQKKGGEAGSGSAAVGSGEGMGKGDEQAAAALRDGLSPQAEQRKGGIAAADPEAERGRARSGAGSQGSLRGGEGEKGPRLSVIDLRRDAGSRGAGSDGNGAGGEGRSGGEAGTGRGGFSQLIGQKALQGEKGGNGTDPGQQMQFEVRTAAAGGQSSAASRTADRASNGLFSQLRQQLGDEIVKKSTILVRENGSGEIRLNLKPEHLGTVRIRISLEDNHIAGKIFVDNQGVRDAFEQNLQNLQRSFREHGFEDASLDVSVGEEKRGRQGGGKNAASSKKSAQTHAARTMGEQVPNAENGYGEQQLIDLVV